MLCGLAWYSEWPLVAVLQRPTGRGLGSLVSPTPIYKIHTVIGNPLKQTVTN